MLRNEKNIAAHCEKYAILLGKEKPERDFSSSDKIGFLGLTSRWKQDSYFDNQRDSGRVPKII